MNILLPPTKTPIPVILNSPQTTTFTYIGNEITSDILVRYCIPISDSEEGILKMRGSEKKGEKRWQGCHLRCWWHRDVSPDVTCGECTGCCGRIWVAGGCFVLSIGDILIWIDFSVLSVILYTWRSSYVFIIFAFILDNLNTIFIIRFSCICVQKERRWVCVVLFLCLKKQTFYSNGIS